MNTTELKSAMLEVLDRPTDIRIIVETKIPILDKFGGPLYFMIDHGDCLPEKVYENWQVTNSAGECREFSTNSELLKFFEAIHGEAISRVYVESF